MLKTTCQHFLLLVGFDTLIYRKYYDTPPILVGHQPAHRRRVGAGGGSELGRRRRFGSLTASSFIAAASSSVPGSWHEPGLKLRRMPRAIQWSFSPGSCYEPGLMPPTEPGPLVHGALANRTGTNAWHWSPFIPEPGLMPNLALDQSPVFY